MITYKNQEFKVPVKIWVEKKEDIEDSCLKQISNMASLPFVFHHVAIMPDTHTGYGMPIGGVLATENVIIPNAVGVDIGCGMCAVKTYLRAKDLDINTLKRIMGKIREVIPVGFNHHKEKQDKNLMPNLTHSLFLPVCVSQYDSALTQLGTLGGGNHFIEIQKDTDDNIWIMIHSGSRNLGKKVADYYNNQAVNLNRKWFSSVPKEYELAFLPIEIKEARNYMTEMQYCVDFALANRKLMMDKIKQIFEIFYKNSTTNVDGKMINIAHNYASWENHFGKNVIVHRKGATLAREGTIGIIPGCQGSKSYIVRGLGNSHSFNSCSHGAGRVMGRKEATRKLNLEEEQKKLDNQGIIHSIRNLKDLDEASGAYKDIDVVMNNQKDLVEILVELQPLAVIKG